MREIVFIVPPHVQYKQYIKPSFNEKHVKKADGQYYAKLVTDMPLGPMCLSSFLKSRVENIEISLVDLNIELNELPSFSFKSYYDYFCSIPDTFNRRGIEDNKIIFAVSALFSPSFEATIDLGRALKHLFPNSLILAGGNIPSNMFKKFLDATDAFSAVCYGEGELPLLEILQCDDSLTAIKQSDAWITHEKLASGFIPKHNFIENLDEIPIPDYELCGEKYFENAAFSTYGKLKNNKRSFHIMTSRGCPFRCIFCASHKVHGRKMRYYSIERMKEEFSILKNKYNAEVLIFQDDHLMGDQERAQALIEYVGRLGLKAVFQNSLTLYALKRKMLETIKNAGVDELVLSIESGSERVLKEVMKKPLKLRIVEQVAADCRDLNIYTYANILIGLPGETKNDIEDTRHFLRSLSVDWFSIFCANPLVGSEMHEICEENNYLDEGWIGSDFKNAVVSTEQWDAAYIAKMAYMLNLELNFKFNTNIGMGKYELALVGILKAIKAKHDHAIAHYYAGICYKHLSMNERCQYHFKLSKKYSEDPVWAKWINILELDDEMKQAFAAWISPDLYNDAPSHDFCLDDLPEEKHSYLGSQAPKIS